jgi:hypothetical protein
MMLGGSGSLAESFPPKPKGMHWRTYWRLYDLWAGTKIVKIGADGVGLTVTPAV